MYICVCIYIWLFELNYRQPTPGRCKPNQTTSQTALQECKVCYVLSGLSRRGHSLLFALGLFDQFCQGGGEQWGRIEGEVTGRKVPGRT